MAMGLSVIRGSKSLSIGSFTSISLDRSPKEKCSTTSNAIHLPVLTGLMFAPRLALATFFEGADRQRSTLGKRIARTAIPYPVTISSCGRMAGEGAGPANGLLKQNVSGLGIRRRSATARERVMPSIAMPCFGDRQPQRPARRPPAPNLFALPVGKCRPDWPGQGEQPFADSRPLRACKMR